MNRGRALLAWAAIAATLALAPAEASAGAVAVTTVPVAALPTPAGEHAVRCLRQLMFDGRARAVDAPVPAAASALFSVLGRPATPADATNIDRQFAHELYGAGVATFDPRGLRLLDREPRNTLYLIPVTLAPPAVPPACSGPLHALALPLVRSPQSDASGPGVCAVDMIPVATTTGSEQEAYSPGCVALRAFGSYGAFLPQVGDTLDNRFVLAPDAVQRVGFTNASGRTTTVVAAHNLVRAPGPAQFFTQPGASLAVFAKHLAALLPTRITQTGGTSRTLARPVGLVATYARLMHDAATLLVMGGVTALSWSV